MNIFFTCKNTLVILLQMYRLLVLCLERRPQYRRQSRLFSLIPPVGIEFSSRSRAHVHVSCTFQMSYAASDDDESDSEDEEGDEEDEHGDQSHNPTFFLDSKVIPEEDEEEDEEGETDSAKANAKDIAVKDTKNPGKRRSFQMLSQPTALERRGSKYRHRAKYGITLKV